MFAVSWLLNFQSSIVMGLFYQSLDQQVKPEQKPQVERVLAKEMFWNLRLAVGGLMSGMFLYYAMLMMDSGIEKHIRWFVVQMSFAIPISIFFLFGEEWIKNITVRVRAANTVVFGIMALIGVGFTFQIPHIKNPTILLTSYCLVIGVLGTTAFTFACNPFSFIFASVGWLGPMLVWLLLYSGDLGSMILGGMGVVYVGALWFLSLKDYSRRVELIKTELNLVDEKEQVITASAKLKESLDLVNALKTQQDGDYYLTSLLLNPLSVNGVDEGLNIDVQFLTKQKKYFEFKKQKKSIGGDISIAHTLEFANGPVTIFLNADAMGKSMQGAGGSLVLGAVFQSIIERTRTATNKTDLKCDNWLISTFIELQKVFESFDCSMLVSIYLGIIENETGTMYHVNAEHPWGVLYRHKKAVFLQNRNYYRKLGTPGLQGDIAVDTIDLEDGDIIILGSDGRDDVDLGSVDGQRNINEDETLFLNHVEQGKSVLHAIFEHVKEAGEITDDFSLIRIEYKKKLKASAIQRNEPMTASHLLRDAKEKIDAGKPQAAIELLSRAYKDASAGPRALRAALNLSMQIKEYDLASHIGDKLLQLSPFDPEVTYLMAFAEKKRNQTNKALYYAEKLRDLEGSGNLMNLILLAELYSSENRPLEARSVLTDILKTDPENNRAQKMLQLLEG